MSSTNETIPDRCSHDFIEDWIDIDPDRSQRIVYCRICEISIDMYNDEIKFKEGSKSEHRTSTYIPKNHSKELFGILNKKPIVILEREYTEDKSQK